MFDRWIQYITCTGYFLSELWIVYICRARNEIVGIVIFSYMTWNIAVNQ